MIKVDTIRKSYGSNNAVENFSFEIGNNEIVGLLGHNGAGKTTLLKMLTGYLEPTDGSIVIDGDDILNNRKKIQKMIGYLPENCPVYPDMTVAGFLNYSAALHDISENGRLPLIRDALIKTDLLDKANQQISTLSRGYRQRTGVARAILHKPQIIILDEPTNGLDPTQIQQMRTLIHTLSQHSTIILSTHILQEVQAVCNRVIIMRNGYKALDSTLSDLQNTGNLHLTLNCTTDDAKDFFAQRNDIKTALQLPSVKQDTDKPPSETSFILTLQNNFNHRDVAADIGQQIYNKGWQLYSMRFEVNTLESVFAEISGQVGQ